MGKVGESTALTLLNVGRKCAAVHVCGCQVIYQQLLHQGLLLLPLLLVLPGRRSVCLRQAQQRYCH
jgi:hypothetical protein